MKNTKGFTLIELLAVIVILGVILVIAIPSISAAILNARKNSYVVTANEFVDGVRITSLTDPSVLPSSGTNCISISDIKLEKGSKMKSPFGKNYNQELSEVCVTYEEEIKDYIYSICLVDEAGNGLSSNNITTLNKSDVKIGDASCDGSGSGGSSGDGGSNPVIGFPSDWLVSTSTNSTGGYTLLSFIGNIDNSSNINVDNDYYNDANISMIYLDFLGIESAEEMSNSNAYTINIPNTVADKTITELGPSLFSVFVDGEEGDEINESYLRIRSVNIPAGIKKISEVQEEQDFDQMRGSFIFNIHLSTVSLPSSLIEIGNFAFLYNDLNNITIPKTVTAIGHLSFGQISNIESITFEGASDGTSQLEYIGDMVFTPVTEIPNLTPLNITIPASVETIGWAAFGLDNITNLTFMGASDGTSHLKVIGSGAFTTNNITELVIPASVENIMINAFYDNPLASLIFAGTSTDGSGNDTSSLTTIGDHGVFDLYNVNNIVYLPSSLTNIGQHALGCDYRDSLCTFYINRLSIPETYHVSWAGNYARKYILDGQGGYTCVENCP